MTPMIDIVFLLIIFFMTVSQITRTVDHAVDLPNVAAVAQPGVKPSTITLNIDLHGKIIIAGRELSLIKTRAALEKQLVKVGGDESKIKIQLRVDRRCESQHVNRVIELLEELRFKQVRVAVSEK